MTLAMTFILLFLGIIILSLVLLGFRTYALTHKLPYSLLLVFLGILLSGWHSLTTFINSLGPLFEAIVLVSFLLLVFDLFSWIKITERDTHFLETHQFLLVFLFLLLTLFTFFISWYLFKNISILSILASFLLSCILVSTCQHVHLFHQKKNRLISFLSLESLVTGAFALLVPLLLIETYQDYAGSALTLLFLLFTRIIFGVGTGAIIGFLFLRILSKKLIKGLFPLLLIVTLLASYFLSEALEGFGILSVATIGFFYGTFLTKSKEELSEFTTPVGHLIEVSVFLLLGLIIQPPLTILLLRDTIILFLVYYFIRYLVAHTFFQKRFTQQEKIFLTFHTPKGTVVAAIILFLHFFMQHLTLPTELLHTLTYLLSLGVYFIFLSLLFSYATLHSTLLHEPKELPPQNPEKKQTRKKR